MKKTALQSYCSPPTSWAHVQNLQPFLPNLSRTSYICLFVIVYMFIVAVASFYEWSVTSGNACLRPSEACHGEATSQGRVLWWCWPKNTSGWRLWRNIGTSTSLNTFFVIPIIRCCIHYYPLLFLIRYFHSCFSYAVFVPEIQLTTCRCNFGMQKKRDIFLQKVWPKRLLFR